MKSRAGAIVIEGHVQGLSNTRSLGEAGIPVFVLDKNNCIAQYSKYCTKFFRCPDFESDDFAEFLVELAIKENINGWVLIPSNDHAVYTISKHKSQLEEHYKVITPGHDVIDNIYDKSKLLEIARTNGIPIPKTQYIKNSTDQLNGLEFPVLTKGRFGLSFYKATGKKAFFAKTQNVLKTQLREIEQRFSLEKTFTQELIPFDGTNKTISFTAFCIDGVIKTYWMGEKLREHPIRFGTATFAKSVFVEECLHQSTPLLKALNYTGVCEVEYLKDPRDNEFKLIEINARTWLWVGLAKECGVDYANLIYAYLNNQTINFPKNYHVNRYWINPITDLVYSFLAILKFKLSPTSYFTTIIKRGNVNALFQKGDIKPGLMYFFKVFSFVQNR